MAMPAQPSKGSMVFNFQISKFNFRANCDVICEITAPESIRARTISSSKITSVSFDSPMSLFNGSELVL